MEDSNTLLQDTNLLVAQQVVATNTATASEEELFYINPDPEKEIREAIESLITAGYLEEINAKTPENLPETFYAATPALRDDMQEMGLWDGMGIIYQLYENTERTERIETIREHKPDGVL